MATILYCCSMLTRRGTITISSATAISHIMLCGCTVITLTGIGCSVMVYCCILLTRRGTITINSTTTISHIMLCGCMDVVISN